MANLVSMPDSLLTRSALAWRNGSVRTGTRLSRILHFRKFSMTSTPASVASKAEIMALACCRYCGEATINLSRPPGNLGFL